MSSSLAKFYGGVALVGKKYKRQRAESIRESFIKSDLLRDSDRVDLLTLGGLVNGADFWIDNESVNPAAMNADNIILQLAGLRRLESKHSELLAKTNPTHMKDAARQEIRKYIERCDFVFESKWV